MKEKNTEEEKTNPSGSTEPKQEKKDTRDIFLHPFRNTQSARRKFNRMFLGRRKFF
ncbi:MAG: hypothetical protein NTZ97_04060 [Candidatus Moranbacteria bacterium]|nr:hypothetical protein [Candidatus Moranbacteria bacterium]